MSRCTVLGDYCLFGPYPPWGYIGADLTLVTDLGDYIRGGYTVHGRVQQLYGNLHYVSRCAQIITFYFFNTQKNQKKVKCGRN